MTACKWNVRELTCSTRCKTGGVTRSDAEEDSGTLAGQQEDIGNEHCSP
jgi:hypothetical protein